MAAVHPVFVVDLPWGGGAAGDDIYVAQGEGGQPAVMMLSLGSGAGPIHSVEFMRVVEVEGVGWRLEQAKATASLKVKCCRICCGCNAWRAFLFSNPVKCHNTFALHA
jgi:hypothetical protein